MMKIGFSIWCLIGVSNISFAQEADFDYSHSLEGITEQWHRIALPAASFNLMKNNRHDLRVYGLTGDQETLEVPYLWRSKEAKKSSHLVEGQLLDRSHTAAGYYYTYQLPERSIINQLDLELGLDNFDWQLKLEGSYNQKDWFTINDESRIVAIKNEFTNYRFTSLTFDQAQYIYYRILIPSQKDPKLNSLKSSLRSYFLGEYRQYDLLNRRRKVDSENKVQLDLELEQALPISRIELKVEDAIDYYRPLVIQYLADSVKVANDLKYIYKTAYRGTLSSLEKSIFNFDEVVSAKLRILVTNYDNKALELGPIKVSGYVHELVARFIEPAQYSLYYGNKKASRPQYDLAAFESKIPKDASLLTLGPQRKMQTGSPGDRALFRNSMWLWALMLVIILILGYFSLSMMKNMKS